MSPMRRHLLAGSALAALALAPCAALAQLVTGGTPQTSAGGEQPVIIQSPGTNDITLGAARTIIPWQTFNLGADEIAVFRFQSPGWIVLNKVAGSATINGQIEAIVGNTRRSGNVWFSAPGGVVFGPSALVNVGSLLATTGTISEGDFLDPGNATFHVSGAGGGAVSVAGGALLGTNGGTIALIGGSVSTGGDANVISNSGTVLYGAADTYTVRFAPVAGDLDLLDFVVPAGSGSATPLSIAGTSVGGNVILAAVSRTGVASAVISAPGLIAAQTAQGGGGDVILASGVDIVNRQPGLTSSNTTTSTTAQFGLVSSAHDLMAAFGQPTDVTAGQLSSGHDLGLAARGLDVDTINSARLLAVNTSQGITIRTSAAAGSNATFTAGGAVSAPAIDTAGRLTINAGTLSAGRLNASRSVVINGSGPAGAGASSASVAVDSILAADDIVITTTDASGHIRLTSATITGTGADEAPAGRNLSLVARGGNADVFYGGGSGAPIIGAGNVTLSAGRDVTANVQGRLDLASGTAGGTFTIRANDLEIQGPLNAGTLRVESAAGPLTLGGSTTQQTTNDGLLVTDAEFQRITVTGGASFYAGSAIDGSRGDLTVRDLGVTTSRIPKLTLDAAPTRDIVISGTIAPVASGGSLLVGDPNDASFRPGRILVSGAIGSSSGASDTGFTNVRSFNTVALNATKDVLIGSSRFISLVASADPATINLSRSLPTGVDPTADEAGKIYITAGTLSITGSTRILQQNSGSAATPNGLFLANAATPTDTVLTVTPAQVVDLFGAYKDATGAVKGGLTAGNSGAVVVTGGQSKGIRFNGCDISGTCGQTVVQTTVAQTVQVLALAPASPADQPAPATASSGDSGGSSDSGSSDSGSSSGGTRGPPPPPALMSVAQPNLDEEVSDPVTIGAGSDELWRGRAKRKKSN
jgi:filamentous hemagglutinin family protein